MRGIVHHMLGKICVYVLFNNSGKKMYKEFYVSITRYGVP
jgi:hypothetical protein